MRDIKIKYIFKDLDNGELISLKFSITEIEENKSGILDLLKNKYVELIARCEDSGLKDKYSVDICEGDIVVKDEYVWFDNGVPNYRGTVELVFSQWQVIAHCINPLKSGISDGINYGMNDDGIKENQNSEWEVIGNIYENPELLEPQNEQ